jgi:hypothetical protein
LVPKVALAKLDDCIVFEAAEVNSAILDDLTVPTAAEENLEVKVDNSLIPMVKGEEWMDDLMVPEAPEENMAKLDDLEPKQQKKTWPT